LGIAERFAQAWSAFRKTSENQDEYALGPPTYSGSDPPNKVYRSYSNERTILASIYTRMSLDVSDIDLRHVSTDEQSRFKGDVGSSLNNCLTISPNIDQGPRAFRQDIAQTLFDEGVCAIVPVDTVGDPNETDKFDIYQLRVARVVTWYPEHVRVSCYNEKTGKREEVVLHKNFVAIIENPLFDVMNRPNSTLQRLIRKLNLLDIVDEQSSSGKLDIIIQLPYVIKSESLRQRAEQRRQDIEFQLKGSQYGIAYADGTEKITQLNRPAENNLLEQVKSLLDLLYTQLGITPEVMNGTADESTMNNYYHRAIKPIADVIVESMTVSFIPPLAVRRGERIRYFRDPFKFTPMDKIAEIADKFARNEIITSNEIRGAIGLPPSDDPKADKLINSNMPPPATPVA